VKHDFHTLSFVLREVLDERGMQDWPRFIGQGDPVSLPTMIRHVAVSIWTFNTFREMMFPQIMGVDIRLSMASLAVANPRDSLTPAENWVLLPLNDLRDWTDTDLAAYRFFLSTRDLIIDPMYVGGSRSHQHKSTHSLPVPDPLGYIVDWMMVAMRVYMDARHLIYLATPCFGWYMYTDEIINRMYNSTEHLFFVHRSGTWAFFHTGMFYNANAAATPYDPPTDTLTEFNITRLENCVFDKIHFEIDGAVLDTSFLALYNEAIAVGDGAPGMDPMTLDDLRLHWSMNTPSGTLFTNDDFFGGVHHYTAVQGEILEIVATGYNRTWYLWDYARERKTSNPEITVPERDFFGGYSIDFDAGFRMPGTPLADLGGPWSGGGPVAATSTMPEAFDRVRFASCAFM
jgi:hypothetical protein